MSARSRRMFCLHKPCSQILLVTCPKVAKLNLNEPPEQSVAFPCMLELERMPIISKPLLCSPVPFTAWRGNQPLTKHWCRPSAGFMQAFTLTQ
mmetsp:Transcript_67621/g.207135  ORF Transcript_67621/g.207135 Transcript_67621/m.207135 type:complete len:93 (+) Transcript_67621:188-466(+)